MFESVSSSPLQPLPAVSFPTTSPSFPTTSPSHVLHQFQIWRILISGNHNWLKIASSLSHCRFELNLDDIWFGFYEYDHFFLGYSQKPWRLGSSGWLMASFSLWLSLQKKKFFNLSITYLLCSFIWVGVCGCWKSRIFFVVILKLN